VLLGGHCHLLDTGHTALVDRDIALYLCDDADTRSILRIGFDRSHLPDPDTPKSDIGTLVEPTDVRKRRAVLFGRVVVRPATPDRRDKTHQNHNADQNQDAGLDLGRGEVVLRCRHGTSRFNLSR
jgi:hypothetical protein